MKPYSSPRQLTPECGGGGGEDRAWPLSARWWFP